MSEWQRAVGWVVVSRWLFVGIAVVGGSVPGFLAVLLVLVGVAVVVAVVDYGIGIDVALDFCGSYWCCRCCRYCRLGVVVVFGCCWFVCSVRCGWFVCSLLRLSSSLLLSLIHI